MSMLTFSPPSIYSAHEYNLTSPPTAFLPLEITAPLILSAFILLTSLLFSGRFQLREVQAGKAYGETVRKGGRPPGFEILEGGWIDVEKERRIVEEYRQKLKEEGKMGL